MPNPVFAAFSSTDEEQKAMQGRLKELAGGTAYNGNAGEWTAFIVLADRKLKVGGTLAMVLPLSFLSGHDSKRVRKLAARNYGEICAISISAYTDPEASFSSNTDMAECILVGRKIGHRSCHAIFGILSSAPSRPFDGAAIGRIMVTPAKSAN